MNVFELSEQELGRREALKELRQMGIDPYPAAEFPVDAYSTDIRSEFDENSSPRLHRWPLNEPPRDGKSQLC